MSLVFYYSPMSTAEITHVVLEELGVPYEKVTLDIRKGDTKKPEFQKINPNGKVPVLVVDGQSIFESSAITMYLGETFGVEKGLFPAAGIDRAHAFKWLTWMHVSLGGSLSRQMHASSDWVPAEQHNAKMAEAAKKEVEQCLTVLNDGLSGKSFLLGEKFSIVDAHVGSFMEWVAMSGYDLKAYPNIHAWVGRVQERPVAKRMRQAQK